MEPNRFGVGEAAFILPRSYFILSSNLDPGSGFPGERQTNLRVGVKKWKTLLQSNFRRYLGEIRIVCALREMSEHKILCDTIKAVPNPVGHVFIREMAKPRK